ncbi:MAG: hypothetical protein WBS19_01120 [Candidatus Korobacteraceae bacterium]
MKRKNKIFVIVERGLAEVVQETVPFGCIVEVVDLDAIRLGDTYPSRQARQIVRSLGRA